MSHSITVSDSVFKRLDEQARRNRTTPDDLAERLLAELLGGDEHAWRARFAALLARVHDRAVDMAPADIEADITTARSEARAERRARHRPA